MKFIILAFFSYAVMLEAYPHDGIGLFGQRIGSGIGSGVGVGVGRGVGFGINGVETIGLGALGLGLGAAELGSGLVEGVGTGLSTGLGAGLGLAGVYDGVQRYESSGRRQQQQYQHSRQGYNNRGQHQNPGPYVSRI
ncbi:isoniazid-induced protein IniB-like [Nymphalis io]|uniref:isoniazid-induced protein IniB-like n=1 Tax=Inachis io TaxID=171585 RepID=UPI002168A28D|nr:isoniazid-induced protein IniB-like [Nymphalis io]